MNVEPQPHLFGSLYAFESYDYRLSTVGKDEELLEQMKGLRLTVAQEVDSYFSALKRSETTYIDPVIISLVNPMSLELVNKLLNKLGWRFGKVEELTAFLAAFSELPKPKVMAPKTVIKVHGVEHVPVLEITSATRTLGLQVVNTVVQPDCGILLVRR